MTDDIFMAKVGSVNSRGITLIIPPSTTATTKRYKRLLTDSYLSSEDEVLVAKVSGTYVVLDKIGYS